MTAPVLAAAAAPVTIQWNLFAYVLGAALAGTVVIAVSYTYGLRFLEAARGGADAHLDTPRPAAMAVAVLCFAIGIAAVVFGLILVIPQLKSLVFPS